METSNTDILGTLEAAQTVEDADTTLVRCPLQGSVEYSTDAQQEASTPDDGTTTAELVDLGSSSLADALTISSENLGHSMARLLGKIDNAASSFGGYNPNHSE